MVDEINATRHAHNAQKKITENENGQIFRLGVGGTNLVADIPVRFLIMVTAIAVLMIFVNAQQDQY
jgi:hypothetical protein